MKRKPYTSLWRRLDKRFLGSVLIAVGIATLAYMFLPVTGWIALIGIVLIFLGYKLFCNY
ncbi:MAG: hypothetical protein N4A57_11580 [Anaeromicrobium sp.]|jgi:predicted branched-subunit amino acid permease|uniref:hypothetical protein n=1 Tax=Anaeromicrobium sp. TaxID=1929132 RepID=UPI0025CB7E1E|nr:hypothetical protein [Anaeromicrobium sp.]MCT4594893.1 hypothetical protein [Anaeromicrobium sp.]